MSQPIVDLHSHWGTRRGYLYRSAAELEHQRRVWKREADYRTEAEMAEDFRRSGVQVMLDLGFTKYVDPAELSALHDYALETQRTFPDVILGNWLQIDPRTGAAGLAEFRRCLDRAAEGLVGYCVSGAALNLPADDPLLDPYYRLCIEARMPVLILVGYTALGAGMPGGNGVRLDACHPRHIDEVAARHPDLTIVAGRAAWPWQDDMIAVLLHKPNVWNELHGWSPKRLPDSLKHDIARRLQDRVMFGADYPNFSHDRLVALWREEGYADAVLDKLFRGNAQALFASLGRTLPPMSSV